TRRGRHAQCREASQPGAVSERFATFLDGSAWSVNQIRFIETIIDELTTNGVVEVSRLFEDPYRDIIPAPMDPETGFDMGSLVEIRTILSDFKDSAVVA
ncbi:MAG: type I restriction-modification enzyme R subunit C-terminal domain-containing protein, partial [Candidatus Corynebacterium faecigallinarum]